MNGRPDFGQLVTGWLADDATSAGSDRVLAAALQAVAVTDQERHLTQRLFGDRLGRSRRLRWTLAAAALMIAAVGTVALLAGAFRSDPPVPVRPVNGWIPISANGGAGDDLTGTNIGRGANGDIYLVGQGVDPRRIIGSDGDRLHQMCPVFSPAGDRLAYVVLDLRDVTPTDPPRPEGAPADDPPAVVAPAVDAPPAWRIVVVEIGPDGTPNATVLDTAAVSSLASCAEWSADGQRLAYVATTPAGRRELRIVTLDGDSFRLGPEVDPLGGGNYTYAAKTFDWSPDGSAVAFADDTQVWLIPIDGQPPRSIPAAGVQAVEWSPDAARLALGASTRIRILDVDGTDRADLAVVPAGTAATLGESPAMAWSPDGSWLAWAEADDVVRAAAATGRTERRHVDLGPLFEDRGSEPLGPRSPSVIGWTRDGSELLLSVGGVDLPGALVSIRWHSDAPASVIVAPTYACTCGDAGWQGAPD